MCHNCASSPDEQNINNAGGIPATDANPYFNATLFLEAARKAGKSTPVDNTVHKHSVIGVQERELASIAYCECGIAFADVTVSDAINTLLDHINNPAADEAKIEAHRARVAYSTRGDFKMKELFPQTVEGSINYTLTCTECAVEVKNVYEIVERHVAWHNKLLP